MQVSLYMDEELVAELDRIAASRGASRSRLVQELLREALSAGGQAARVAESGGTWEDSRSAREIVEEIYETRTGDPGRMRPEW